MSRVIRIYKQGTAEVLTAEDHLVGIPEPGQVRVRQEAIGVNYVDVYMRSGFYGVPTLPFIPGVEGAGVIEEVGENVINFKVGDRVAYIFSLGGYAQHRVIQESFLLKIPDFISFEIAAAILAKGLTARMLLKQAYQVKSADTLLIHAAAGGVGSLLVRWARHMGAYVIAVVGTAGKIEHAFLSGADLVLLSGSNDFIPQILDFTKGNGVDVVYDGIGGTAFPISIQSVKPGGRIVEYGTVGGNPEIEKYSQEIAGKNIEIDTPALGMYLRGDGVLAAAADDLFGAYQSGILGEVIPMVYPLSDVVQVHKDLEARRTTGPVVMKP